MVVREGKTQILISVFLIYAFMTLCCTKEDKNKETKNEAWKKKKIQDYSEADIERLFDQWEDNDEDELEEDELPAWKREPPKIDMGKIDPNNPEQTLKMSKKGRTLMMFASVSGDPSEKETEKITSLWHSSLFNAHIETQRYVVGSNRVIFMLTDGSKAWDVKDFLVKQDRCEEVTIEGKSYPGLAASQKKSDSKNVEIQGSTDGEAEKNNIKDKNTKNYEREENKIQKNKQDSHAHKKDKSKKSPRIEDNQTSRKKEEL